MAIQINATLAEMKLIESIADRCVPFARKANVNAERGWWLMRIVRAHAFAPLDLEALYTAPDQDFINDVFGIRSYMHDSGQYLTEWRPKCQKPPCNTLEGDHNGHLICPACARNYGDDPQLYGCDCPSDDCPGNEVKNAG